VHGFNSEDSVAFRINALARFRCIARDRKFFSEKIISPLEPRGGRTYLSYIPQGVSR
jgi:hypothetical protein